MLGQRDDIASSFVGPAMSEMSEIGRHYSSVVSGVVRRVWRVWRVWRVLMVTSATLSAPYGGWY